MSILSSVERPSTEGCRAAMHNSVVGRLSGLFVPSRSHGDEGPRRAPSAGVAMVANGAVGSAATAGRVCFGSVALANRKTGPDRWMRSTTSRRQLVQDGVAK